MLYRLSKSPEGKFDSIEPVAFKDFSHLGHLEKDLENIIAANLLDVLFEDNQLMPIFQERKRQEEADIYALNSNGDLIIFELKRGTTGSSAVHQALRYCEQAAPWNYTKLQNKYDTYRKNNGLIRVDLSDEHQQNFDLDTALESHEFNRKQLLMVVGSAGNRDLIQTIDYWKKQGLSLDFVPYRVYEIGDEQYFEFFSIPYDRHSNPAEEKGVIFDTCQSYIKDATSYMLENKRVASFGDQKKLVNYLNKNDMVFLYHKGKGIVAAGKVKSEI
ncbi:hypothetical protein LNTAR_16313 [Lentisphaera araneosa HTCC2155]|uniref:DUF91 domain-containing protein n=1 Tax=Lentisphaera araneosa HTCC2155 TaxID=313628 RepID=A6DQ77_9BACT|nr:hypothetical protein [Lentisphaera araneosa]EDM26128.1 hypothetical protein LNTAR_16313 [Lentisphaera araneosa HTCC2155]